jgi:hypothetical protein
MADRRRILSAAFAEGGVQVSGFERFLLESEPEDVMAWQAEHRGAHSAAVREQRARMHAEMESDLEQGDRHGDHGKEEW